MLHHLGQDITRSVDQRHSGPGAASPVHGIPDWSLVSTWQVGGELHRTSHLTGQTLLQGIRGPSTRLCRGWLSLCLLIHLLDHLLILCRKSSAIDECAEDTSEKSRSERKAVAENVLEALGDGDLSVGLFDRE